MEQWGARLADPEVRASMIAEAEELMASDTRLGNMTAAQWSPSAERWKKLYPILPGWDYEPAPEESVHGIAMATGTPILEVVYDHIAQEGGSGVIWEGYDNLTGFYNHARKKLMHPLIVPGISDAGAHLNIFQDGSTPTSMISFWSRDRKKGPQIPLEISVMKQVRDVLVGSLYAIGRGSGAV